jgi:hypothetical protein
MSLVGVLAAVWAGSVMVVPLAVGRLVAVSVQKLVRHDSRFLIYDQENSFRRRILHGPTAGIEYVTAVAPGLGAFFPAEIPAEFWQYPYKAVLARRHG